MTVLTTSGWEDYELLDTGNGRRLERFGKYTLNRPDPQILWKPHLPTSDWQKADATFERTTEDKGNWKIRTKLSDSWLLHYNNISFYCRLSPFKHTGVFPEQSINWDWILKKIADCRMQIADSREVKILNFFAYTGISSIVAAKARAKVTHVDSSYSAIGWAKENQKASGLPLDSIRWIEDDAIKFCERELKRASKYDAIMMDPPAYGHGPKGETWDFNESFPRLMNICAKLLSPTPLFFLVNTYAISSSSLMLENVLRDYFKNGNIESGELALQERNSDRLLSTGIFARWSSF